MFSGGIDSTYVLYQALTQTSLAVHTHHVQLVNQVEPRWKQEHKAVSDILSICLRYRQFSHSSSMFSHSPQHRILGWDSDIQLLAASRVAPNLPRNTPTSKIWVVLGWTKDSLSREIVRDRVDRNVVPDLWKALCNSLPGTSRECVSDQILFPLLHLTKVEIIHGLPTNLLELTWSCRTPNMDKPCGECHACRLKFKALNLKGD